MKQIKVNLDKRSYKIIIEHGVLSRAGELVSKRVSSKRGVIITNNTVSKLYLEKLEKSFESEELDCEVIKIPDGEQYKTLKTCETIFDRMVDARIDRTGFVVALGGGVVGDIAGYVASTYMRGIEFVQIPTTLLAHVDSSVGGKVGVNLKKGKNLVGSFYQPTIVLIDPSVLETLPEREYAAGITEVIKYGIIWEKSFFSYLERNMDKLLSHDNTVLEKVIAVSCDIKAKVVEDDEREAGLRAILNYGHTVGHAIESATNYKKYLHGEAISIGMCAVCYMGIELGMIDKEVCERIEKLLVRAGLPVKADGPKASSVIKRLLLDKKVRQGKVRFVLPHEIGRVIICESIPHEIVKRSVEKVL